MRSLALYDVYACLINFEITSVLHFRLYFYAQSQSYYTNPNVFSIVTWNSFFLSLYIATMEANTSDQDN